MATLTLLLGACTDKLPDEWELTEYRVLAVVAEPPEIDPDGEVELRVVDLDPDGEPVTYEWSLCLFSFGSATNFACVDERLDGPLEGDGPTMRIDFGPDGFDIRNLYERFGPVPNAAGVPQTLEDGFDVFVHIISRASGGRVESTYKRVRIRDGDPLNTNPVFHGFTIDDEAPGPVGADERVEIKLVIDEADRELDTDGTKESYLYRWYATAGTLERAFGPPSNTVDYTTPEEPGTYSLFVVARDRRGGTALEQIEITVDP